MSYQFVVIRDGNLGRDAASIDNIFAALTCYTATLCASVIGVRLLFLPLIEAPLGRPLALAEKFMTVRPTCTALLYAGKRGVLYLTSTNVPNLEVLSSRRNLPFSSFILAWHRLTEMSFILRSLSWPRPNLKMLLEGPGLIIWMILLLFFSYDRLSRTM